MTEFILGDASPSWSPHPSWLDEDDWTDLSESEIMDDDADEQKPVRKKYQQRKKVYKEKLSLSEDELAAIKKEPNETELSIRGTKYELANYVARQLLFLLIRFRKIAKIRIGQRIRKIHRCSLCFDFNDLFAKSNDQKEFTAHGMDELQELLKMENKYLSRKSGQTKFSWRTVRAQCRKVREKLFVEVQHQYQLQRQIIMSQKQIANLKFQGKPVSEISRALNLLQNDCWLEIRNEKWVLRQMKVMTILEATETFGKGVKNMSVFLRDRV